MLKRASSRGGVEPGPTRPALVALLPDWTRWMAIHNATPPELADRCLPYAEGQAHPQITVDNRTEPDYLARVTE
jgi:hypothetical protein